ncbi:hypothetical protein EDD29_0073 [Actinocorallia herbida]|uniref:Excisionase family DNA binding protein n=1 Tax=Actinocorallia herbida TaxID=58109 RepID=A0A3N1CMQ6_9ACTN|nr:hypothetical protein [Actinocorallia herbida]ROO82592.1 hypothetical protein EDD29_0073 [Actinocorallia herbida]
MLLDPKDPLSEVIPLKTAAAAANVSERTIRRWVEAGHLELLTAPGLAGSWVTRRAVLECERDRHQAARRGRPGARVDSLT